MPLAFLIDLTLLLAAILAALLGVLLLLLGLFDFGMSYWRGDRERWRVAIMLGATGLLSIGAGYLLQLGI